VQWMFETYKACQFKTPLTSFSSSSPAFNWNPKMDTHLMPYEKKCFLDMIII